MVRHVISLLVVAILFFSGCSRHHTPFSSVQEAPRIVSINPSPEQNYVALDQPFIVEFSEAMNTASVEANFAVVVAEQPIAGQYRWNRDNTSVTFQPTEDLPANSAVSVNFGPGMFGRRGQSLISADGVAAGRFSFSCWSYQYPTSFSSNGERIYFTGTSESGDPITFNMHVDERTGAYSASMPYGRMMDRGYTGRGMMGFNWGMSMGRQGGMSCASCHGPDGRGNRYLAMGLVVTPDIRFDTLTAADTDHAEEAEEDEDEHGHVPYDEESLKRAITQGVEPDGEPLNSFMPRWSISDRDLNDLVVFLKTL